MDASVYDAMVILAQDFSTNCTLIDGHGNWGSIDGDSAAAMRYTEARLSNIALEMLRDIDKGTVNMVPNYSASELEPAVLPARYPNLLVNGTFGIAVGLATNIPPHNLNEVIDATCSLIDKPELETKELMGMIKGPDLPTGGELIGKESMVSAYETGTGKVALRAKTHIETLENGRFGIVITEFPYKKNKSRILQSISDMTGDKAHSKSLELITDIRDESDRSGIRAVIEFKKSITKDNVEKVLKYLLKKTDLQCNLSFNMVAIADGKPETLSLKAILKYYIEHQKEVIRRRTQTELDEAKKRHHIVEGYIKALSVLDDVVATIRASKSKEDSIRNLMSKFDFTEIQANAIVTLMLYRLTNMEVDAFEKEYKELVKKIKKLQEILDKEKVLLNLLKTELNEIKEKYGTPRKTVIIKDGEVAKIDVEEILIDEDVVITQSNDGFVKRMPAKSYSRSNTNTEVSEIEYREGDFNKFLYNANTKDSILFFTNKGVMYQTKCVNIPEAKWKDKGVRLSEFIKGINLEEEEIVSVIPVSEFTDSKVIVFVTENGGIKKMSLGKFATNYTKMVATKIKNDDIVINAILMDKNDSPFALSVETEKGFNFVTEGITIEDAEKSVLPALFTTIAPNDKLTSVDIVDGAELEQNLCIGFDSDFVVDIIASNVEDESKKTFNFEVGHGDQFIALTDKGNVLTIPCYMMQKSKSVDFKMLVEDKVVSLMVVPAEKISSCAIFMFTNTGQVKKTMFEDFKGLIYASGYKLKDGDAIVSGDYGTVDKSDVVVLTRKGMCIRFGDGSFSSMGRNASGVAAIKLKDDEAIFGFVTDENKKWVVRLNDNKRPLNLDKVDYRNRGTMGIELKSEIKTVTVSME